MKGTGTPLLRIGIDFDNTIVCYDLVMHSLAVERGLIEPGHDSRKKDIRDSLRRLPDGETHWRALQVETYAHRMQDAEPFPGVAAFFALCREQGVPLAIVSHKTRYPNFGDSRADLRQGALAWLDRQGFFGPAGLGLDRARVFFESTREEKVARIAGLNLTHFIDDLEEVFETPGFPEQVGRLLFAQRSHAPLPGVTVVPDWRAIRDFFFKECGHAG
jgi:hypothetical protein